MLTCAARAAPWLSVTVTLAVESSLDPDANAIDPGDTLGTWLAADPMVSKLLVSPVIELPELVTDVALVMSNGKVKSALRSAAASASVKIVLDTTILVRANEHSHGLARELLINIVGSKHTLLLSNEMFNELAKVLRSLETLENDQRQYYAYSECKTGNPNKN